MFNNSRNFQISGGNFVVQSNVVQSGIDRLYQYCTTDAAHDSYARRSRTRCLEGTRTQYIQAVTDWASTPKPQHHLLWLWGPAGVGKTSIAQSCAKGTAARGTLGATFFFSRDNSVVDATHFFTTIAYQLAAQLDDYKTILGSKIQRNPSILTKGLDSQLRELIIVPFLELERRKVHTQRRTIFVDGLDECSDEFTQSEVVRLVADSVAQYGRRVPLLWAFFSRPERLIDNTFSKYSSFPFCWLIKLPVSRNDDPDIRLYFRACLKLPSGNILDPTSNQVLWPSENDLTALVMMVRGLFIYAAVIVKFITDPDSLSPQRQLQDVLSLRSGLMRSVQSGNQDSPLAGLDCFYRMIMSRIPTKLLPVVQQILLVHTKWTLPFDVYLARVYSSPPVRLLANLLGLTLQELENCLSKLRSVLTFQQTDESPVEYRDKERDSWLGSSKIVFYHASFMEFLRDQKRSGQYCIENQSHWAALAVNGLRLLKNIYAMNGMSRDEKIRELRKSLPVFLGDAFSTIEGLDFRDELCHEFLFNYIPTWCQCSGFADEVVEELRRTDTTMLMRLEEGSNNSIGWRQFPQHICLVDPPWKINHRPSPFILIQERRLREPSARLESILTYIASALDIITDSIGDSQVPTLMTDANHSSIQERSSLIHFRIAEYFSAYVRDVIKMAKNLKLETLDEFDFLEYFQHEWRDFDQHRFSILPWRAPENIIKVALLPWEMHFFPTLQGTDNRLTKAALRRLKQLRDRDLLSKNAQDALERFFESTTKMRPANNFSSTSYYAEHVKVEFLRATKDYYSAERIYLLHPDDTLLPNLMRVAARLAEEQYLYLPGENRSDIMQLCTNTLLEDHREELNREFAVNLAAGNDDNLAWILRASAWSPTMTSQLLVVFKGYVKKAAFDAILVTNRDGVSSLKGPDAFEHDLLDVLQQSLRLIEGSLEANGAKYYVPDGCAKIFRNGIDQVLEEILNSYPQYGLRVRVLYAERARKARETAKWMLGNEMGYKCLYESDVESYIEELRREELDCEQSTESDREELNYGESPDSDQEASDWEEHDREEPPSPIRSNEITSNATNLGTPRQPDQSSGNLNSHPPRIPTPSTNEGIIGRTQHSGTFEVLEESASHQHMAEAGGWALVGEIIDYFLRPWSHGWEN